jgi:hypothetical protein
MIYVKSTNSRMMKARAETTSSGAFLLVGGHWTQASFKQVFAHGETMPFVQTTTARRPPALPVE